ncbi:PTS sugar transporter subunit IIB [Bacillus sp. FJAT-50079]|uniref:PTS sugar transporter subunit IIB n=1 Tax=Bacillus sp. FJAT-50079 TaxID=2833577 RepID=UPI001BC9698E|nr:PTS sugar transporter subunit IIB [Bacillus sp. FJAT-50079]MBS4210180.1 PTS sugar transporter subunit IIB [Bacillus sp. FJAT-50079]
MLKVLAACGAGIGSSQIIKMKIKKVCEKLNIPVEISHLSIGMAKSEADKYDVIFTMNGLVSNFSNLKGDTKVIGLVNLMSENEMETKLKEALGIE